VPHSGGQGFEKDCAAILTDEPLPERASADCEFVLQCALASTVTSFKFNDDSALLVIVITPAAATFTVPLSAFGNPQSSSDSASDVGAGVGWPVMAISM
jgi:hypothetical protein